MSHPILDQSKMDLATIDYSDLMAIECPEAREMLWERHMYAAGQVAYLKNLDKSTEEVSDTTSGQYLIKKTISRATSVIREYQKEIVTSLRDTEIKAMLVAIPAETLALITVRYLIDKTVRPEDPEQGCEVNSMFLDLGELFETEWRFRLWLDQSKSSMKEWVKKKELTEGKTFAVVPKSKAELYMAEKGLSPKAQRNIRKSLQKLAVDEWDEDLKRVLAAEIALSVAQTLDDVFTVHVRSLPDRYIKMIMLKPEVRQVLIQKETQIAQMQVVRKPMLSQPRQWVRVQKAANDK